MSKIRVDAWTPDAQLLTLEYDIDDTEAWLPYVKQNLELGHYMEIVKV